MIIVFGAGCRFPSVGDTLWKVEKSFMDHVTGLKCVLCGTEYKIHEVRYVCPKHGDEDILDVQCDYNLIGKCSNKRGLMESKDYSIWR